MKTNLYQPLIFLALLISFACPSDAQENTPPSVGIESPKEGATYQVGDKIIFSGKAVDLEDGEIAADNLIWTSDIDSSIGKGKSFETAKLSSGFHLIMLTASDSKGKQGRSSVFIEVKAPKPVAKPEVKVSEKATEPAAPKNATPKVVPEKAVKTLPAKVIGPAEKLNGICYGPFRTGQNPDRGIFPRLDDFKTDMTLIPNLTKKVRIYSASKSLGEIPGLCDQFGVECYPGAWLSRNALANESEIAALVDVSKKCKSVKALIVGNEVLLRRDMSEDDLIAYIKQAKSQTILPVSYAEIWGLWFKYPKLAASVDFLTIHVHPYWEGINVNEAAEYVIQAFKKVQAAYPNKRIVLGETGWPSKGDTVGNAVASEKNQADFFASFLALANQAGIEYFYFDLFDEAWKFQNEGEVGANWGIATTDGSIKSLNLSAVPEAARSGANRK